MAAHLVINATMLNSGQLSGLGVYTQCLLSELLPRVYAGSDFDRVTLIGGADFLHRTLKAELVANAEIAHVRTSQPVKRLLQLNRLVRASKRQGNVLFYSTTHHGVITSGIRQVVTIHDLFARRYPYNYRQQYYYFRYYLPRVLRKTDHIVTVSSSTGHDLAKFYRDIPATTTIGEGMRPDLIDVKATSVASLEGQRFFLFVGPSYKYKNCDRLIDAFAVFRRGSGTPTKLVFAGGRASYVASLESHIMSSHSELAPDVHFLDYVEPGELVWLYQNAYALMITTLYEGFGLPALEAMALGCPVIASDRGSLPEVCGESAIYVDPENVDAIQQAMAAIVSDNSRRDDLIKRGRRRSEQFKWGRAAQSVYELLTGVAGTKVVD
jgi:glycosyltransferase involved in cell wall biosynthesis